MTETNEPPDQDLDGSFPTEGDPGGGVEPNWTDAKYPLVGADFVRETLRRVLEDRSKIDTEAALVEQIRFEQSVLDTFPVPDPSPDFVKNTWTRVMAARSAGLMSATEDELELRSLLEASLLPPVSDAFVDRTLESVMDVRRRRPEAPRALADSTTHNGKLKRFSLVAAVAAVLLCAIVILWDSRFWRSDELQSERPSFRPVAFGSMITESDAEKNFDMPFRLGSSTARFAVESGEEGR